MKLSLSLFTIFLLLGCAKSPIITTSAIVPAWPTAGDKVREELNTIPLEGYENFWVWISDLSKFKAKLDVIREE